MGHLTMRAIVVVLILVYLPGCCFLGIGDCDDEDGDPIGPSLPSIDNFWLGYTVYQGVVGLINISIDVEDGELSGWFRWEPTEGNPEAFYRGSVAGIRTPSRVELELVQTDPCEANLSASFQFPARLPSFELNADLCGESADISVVMGTNPDFPSRPGGDVDPPGTDVSLLGQLSRSTFCRDVRVQLPTLHEAQYLDSLDNSLVALVTPNQTIDYVGSLNAILASVGACNEFSGRVVTDLLTLPLQASGGIAGNAVIVMDAEYLDILRDWSNYLASLSQPPTSAQAIATIDAIVARHAGGFGPFPGGLVYPSANLTANQRQIAEATFFELAAVLNFHEYAHFHKWDSLRKFRAPFLNSVSITEDEADLVAGMLTRKAGVPAAVFSDAYDILAFYPAYRASQAVTMAQIADPTYQNTVFSQVYSSLRGRKDLFALGYQQMDVRLTGSKRERISTGSFGASPYPGAPSTYTPSPCFYRGESEHNKDLIPVRTGGFLPLPGG